MKILVFAPYGINNPHFETELEIIQKHLDSGDDIILLGCNANLMACDVNWEHDLATCFNCVGRRIEGVKLLSSQITVKPIYFLTQQNKKEIKELKTDFSSLAELKNFKIENFDIGYGVLSSLISVTRDPEPNLVKHKNVLKRALISSLAVYRSMQNYLSSCNIDKAYVFNGRYAPMRAAFRACQSKNVDCLLHERGSSLNKYFITENTTFHDLEYVRNLIDQAWLSNTNKADREKLASEFYINRKKGILRNWFSFTKAQKKDLLPDNWDSNKINIVIFTSSEDEFASIGDQWKNPIYENQFIGITKILNSIGGDDSIQLYIRLHPNLKNIKSKKQLEQINSLESANLTVISPHSPIDSYSLLEKASKVVTFGSTVGIEAAYWGIPSILLGESLYRELGSTYNPKNHQECMEMIYADLAPKDKKGALMYGYFFNTYGIPFKYYQAEGVFEGTFKEVVIEANKFFKIISKILRIKFLSYLKRLIGKISIIYNQLQIGRII